MFEEIENETFAVREERILNFWKENRIFYKSLEIRKNAPFFAFYDGPPFATGLPHYGHLLAGTIKDVIPRYKTMKGFLVPRRFGWDCHGLPIENEIEKTFQLSGAPSIEAFGIDRFNEECRKIVLRYTEEWKSKVERFGRWVDFNTTWKTMDLPFMETVLWVFKEVYKKGLVYEGYKVMPFSTKLGTPLSNFEATENYKEIDDPSIVVRFEAVEEPNTSYLAWTTTPWTLISNMALTVGDDIEYVKIEELEKKTFFILAKESLTRWFPDEKSYQIVKSLFGRELVGKHYKPLFLHFAHLAKEGAFRIISDSFVTTTDGTGIVHTAPAFGEADFYACLKAKVPFVCPVNNNGLFTDEVPEYEGVLVKDADKDIIRRLKEMTHLFYRGTLRHRYPFCWRSDTPLIYKAISTWFINVEKVKEHLLAANKKIHWMPSHLKEGRFGNWLEGARDWAISRNRYWGTPIPIWRNDEGDIHVIGSIDELESLTGTKITDLHRHYIDQLTFKKNGKEYKRVTEVFDCWFESGSMPYAQNHYPFENKEFTEKTFPADFVAEGVDQTRAWFYTLTVLAVILFDSPAFKNVIANGILLAEDGSKMSKRLRNYPEPDLVVNKYGADAVRLYMLNSPAVKADDLRFSEKGVELSLRQILIPLWNSYVFLATYAKIYNWSPSKKREKPEALIDLWIIALLNRLIKEVEEGLDDYDLSRAVTPFVGFIDQLTNWYIRRSRRRFWADEDTPDRRQAFETLHYVLLQTCKIAAPFVPFLSDAIYQKLRSKEMPESVHLCDYPDYDEKSRNLDLEAGMDALQTAVSLGHSLRKENKIKVRQPLPAAHIVSSDVKILEFLEHQKHLIEDELNVKQAIFHKESQEFVKLSIKPNFRVLGKKVGKHMKEVQLIIHEMDQAEMQSILHGVPFEIEVGGDKIVITQEDVEITRKVHEGWVAMNLGNMTVALDTELNEELILEGMARELVNKINMMRKQRDFAVTDRIHLKIGATEKVKKAIKSFEKTIKEEVLAIDITYGSLPESEQIDINGEPTAIWIKQR